MHVELHGLDVLPGPQRSYVDYIDMSYRMASHTVALDGEAYASLKAQKRAGESFSDVVKRISKPRQSILEFAGAWKDLPAKDWHALQESYRRTRDADRRRTEKLRRIWEKR